MKEQLEKLRRKNILKNELLLVLFSLMVGVLVGAIVALYNIAAGFAEGVSVNWYEATLANPWSISLLLAALFAGVYLISVVIKFIPMARGSGIPQIEGAARGLFRLKWFRMLIAGSVMSLSVIFLGMSAGAEGPSMLIGGCIGNGTAETTGRSSNVRRLLLTGGASSGLAVAFNAPLTGFIFAFEEAHKKFTPEILTSAFFSVIAGVLTRNGLRLAFGLEVSQTFLTYNLTNIGTFTEVLCGTGFVLIAALVAGFLGAALVLAVKALKKLFSRVKFFSLSVKLMIPALLAGIFGLISVYEMGGGHSVMEALGSGSDVTITTIFTEHNAAGLIAVSLSVVLLIKFIATVAHLGTGLPCGSFIPILAVGALVGGLLNLLFLCMGMDERLCDLIIIICFSTFFTAAVRAPLTAMVMSFELTGSFSLEAILPVMLGVAIGYIASKIFVSKGIYELLLEDFVKENNGNEQTVERFTVTISNGLIDGRLIRDVLWPTGLVVERVYRNDALIIPDGNTELVYGDRLEIAVKTDNRERTMEEIVGIVCSPGSGGNKR